MNTAQAVAHFGSKKKLAEALGISPSAVTLWADTIPTLRQFQIQMLTSGDLKAEAEPAPDSNKSSSQNRRLTPGLNGSVRVSSTQQAAQ